MLVLPAETQPNFVSKGGPGDPFHRPCKSVSHRESPSDVQRTQVKAGLDVFGVKDETGLLICFLFVE